MLPNGLFYNQQRARNNQARQPQPKGDTMNETIKMNNAATANATATLLRERRNFSSALAGGSISGPWGRPFPIEDWWGWDHAAWRAWWERRADLLIEQVRRGEASARDLRVRAEYRGNLRPVPHGWARLLIAAARAADPVFRRKDAGLPVWRQ